MSHRVCPWWLGYLLASPLRRWMQNPEQILQPYVHSGMTVFEPGPGMGFFTIPLARMVGPTGKVICVELQPKMIHSLQRRVIKKGLADRVEIRNCEADSMNIAALPGKADFTLAFAVVHEFPDSARFFREVSAVTKPGGKLLLAEPSGHVSEAQFAAELEQASAAGFQLEERPRIPRSQAALLFRR